MLDAGCAAVSVIDDLQQVAPLLSSERRDAPIVQDQHLHARQALEHAGIATVAASQATHLRAPAWAFSPPV